MCGMRASAYRARAMIHCDLALTKLQTKLKERKPARRFVTLSAFFSEKSVLFSFLQGFKLVGAVLHHICER